MRRREHKKALLSPHNLLNMINFVSFVIFDHHYIKVKVRVKVNMETTDLTHGGQGQIQIWKLQI